MRRHNRTAQITLRALVTARWVLLGLLAGTGLLTTLVPSVINSLVTWFPTRPDPYGFAAVLVVWGVINLLTTQLTVRRGRATRTQAGIHLLIDASALTALLGLSGGATNPFTILYFVPITLATQVSPRWTWTLAGYSLACFGFLFALAPMPHDVHGHAGHFAGHLRGMWVAFGVSGALITYFVHSIALSLSRQRSELTKLRNEAMQDRQLAALGTLAAGAAHELGTPLGTIQVLASELPHMQPDERSDAIDSIKRELVRCKEIVQSMASPELRVSALGANLQVAWSLLDIVRDLEDASGEVELDIEIAARTKPDEAMTTQPRNVLSQIVRELVANAAEACRNRDGSSGVRFHIAIEGEEAIITVRDDGIGMDPKVAAAAFDPFFSTKDEGSGMGLGLFLAKAHIRQLGGTISLESEPNRGTEVEVRLPLGPPPPDAAASYSNTFLPPATLSDF